MSPLTPPLLVQILPRLKIGGAEAGALELDAAWDDAGGEGWLVCQEADPDLERQARGRVVALPVATRSPAGLVRAGSALRQILADRPAVLLSHSRSPHMVAWLSSSVKPPRPWVAGVWGLYTPHVFSKQVARAHRVWVASTAAREHATGPLGVEAERVRVHPRGVDPALYETFPAPDRTGIPGPPEAKLALGVGRLSPVKGIEVFLEAIARLEGHDPPVVGAWLGPVESEEAGRLVEERLREPALAGRFALLAAQADPRPRYQAASLVVSLNPKVPEAFGRTVLEAMASARPVVATAAGGPLDLVEDGVHGLLVEQGDPAAAAAAIGRLAADGALRRRLGDAGRARALRDFNRPLLLDAMVEELQELHREVTDEE